MISSAKTRQEYPELECTVFGREFRNPIGIAAGFDKNGEAIQGLRESGFGFVEIGSVTPLPQAANPKPRVFRLLHDKAVINRYGFNSDGVGIVSERVRKAAPNSKVPLGVNLGKNKETKQAEMDYELGATYFTPYCDYLVINVSSPNTPGLRDLQTRDELPKILKTVNTAMARALATSNGQRKLPSLLVKISPDLSYRELRDIASICSDAKNGVSGIIVANTTVGRSPNLMSSMAYEAGGLSGRPLKMLSTECIRTIYALTDGKIPIVGCGGVENGQDAYEKIRAGASLVQFYTALVYEGFPVTGKIKKELTESLRRDGYASVADAVGADHRGKTR